MHDNQTPPSPSDDRQDVIIKGHNYDGIKEYDNPMPGWWVGIFWLSVLFAPFYVLGVHGFGFINSYEDDLAQGQAELAEIREVHAETAPTFDNAAIEAYIGDASQIAAGATSYTTYCLPCHGDQGQGLIGPNLTDNYWIHGNQNMDLFNVITNGIVEEGMTPWGGVLTPEQRAQVIAFVRSLQGTNPPNAKEPQGELYEGS